MHGSFISFEGKKNRKREISCKVDRSLATFRALLMPHKNTIILHQQILTMSLFFFERHQQQICCTCINRAEAKYNKIFTEKRNNHSHKESTTTTELLQAK